MLHYKIRSIKNVTDQKVKYYPAIANVRVMKFKGRNRQTLWGGCTDANPKLLLNDT